MQVLLFKVYMIHIYETDAFLNANVIELTVPPMHSVDPELFDIPDLLSRFRNTHTKDTRRNRRHARQNLSVLGLFIMLLPGDYLLPFGSTIEQEVSHVRKLLKSRKII